MISLKLEVTRVDEVLIEGWEPPKHLFIITTPDNRRVIVDTDALFEWLKAYKVNQIVAHKIANLAVQDYEVSYDGEKGLLTGETSLPVKWEYP